MPRTTSGSATEQAFRHVKRLVLDGSLPGGSMTSEGEIADQLGVSRTPVREAFLRLEAEGLLRLYPKRGALVVPIAPGEVDDVLDARLLVETHAALGVARLPDSELTALVALLRDLVVAQEAAVADRDVAEYATLDARFHAEIVAAGGNDLLTAFHTSLRERQQRMVAHSVRRSEGRAAAFVVGHSALVDALEARDTRTYKRRIQRHLDDARTGL
ncbi:GntR family transcriptional regulator [Cellulosimicrobium arenosum]|uniref:GntR family transcriptional regulator n=1 Tax=Cellulosimicrobium arenosum TaxID=2708133 RepID=A0A927IYV0_9MICO|nr:GntR family transcriptional regulator [Cellulosimicrobium arenosum]MBD8077754.1 GntR family transcriptional regulator [Cellulosimicrobium arenosum]